MKKFLNALLWILTDALMIFALVFLPSFFSLFCFLEAIIIAPIEEWQKILKKFLIKPIRTAAIAIFLAFIVAMFPLEALVNGIHNAITPPSSSEKVIIYYEETSAPPIVSEESTSTSTIESSSSNTVNSDNSYSSSAPANTVTNSDSVYRTPSGKRYHLNPQCGGKNSYEVSLDEATDSGLSSCKKCAK